MGDELGSIKDWVLGVGGNLAIIIFFFRSVGAWLDKQTSAMIGNAIMFVVLIAFVHFNDQTILFAKELAKKIFGWQ